MITKIQDIHGSWTFILPVYNLRLTDVVKNEILVNRVTFITIKKLVRVRKKFGIRKKISELRTKSVSSDFLSNDEQVVAIVRHGGKPAEIQTIAIRLITEELEILCVSQLGHTKRRFNAYPSIYSGNNSRLSFLCLNTGQDATLSSHQVAGKMGSLALDENWCQWQNRFFYFKLVKIIKKEIVVDPSWRDSLYRASRLIGQSITTNNLAQAFLLNMIAIELLLTRQGDKYTEVLPKRIEAFIGWVGYWHLDNYEEKIKDIYQKRCKYVHDGNDSNIEIKDLLFTDDILLNVMLNLVLHHKIFSSKEQIVNFSEKLEAEHILGIVGNKSKIRPKTFSFLAKSYDENDYKKI